MCYGKYKNELLCINNNDNIEEVADLFTNTLYKCVMESEKITTGNIAVSNSDTLLPRWQRILECEDDALLWKAIDWRGEFNSTQKIIRPTESEFQEHLEWLLNPPGEAIAIDVMEYITTVPILDDHINISEVTAVIEKQIKPNKSCGPDGISPGVFKLLPVTWLRLLCTLFNMVFAIGYPLCWVPAKLMMLYKKGFVLDCDNYHGISIINAIAKMIIS